MKQQIFLSASLEGLTGLDFAPDQRFRVDVACTNCQEVARDVTFDLGDEREIFGSRGTATYVAKCKLCQRVGTIDAKRAKGFAGLSEDAGAARVAILDLECRGLEVVKAHAPGEKETGWFALASVSGSRFEIELDDGTDFADFDERSDESLVIEEFGLHTRDED